MIDAMFQEGTDKALDDLVQRPALPKPVEKPGFWRGALSAPFRGVGAGVAESVAYRAETAGAFGEVSAATGAFSSGGMFSVQTDAERKESEAARNKVLAAGPTMSNEAGDLFRARARELMPDPEATGTAAHVIAGLTRFGAKAVGYLAGGPGGAVDLGVDEGLTEADRLKQQGVDIGTRTQAGTVAGVVAGASVLAPMSGATAMIRFGKGVAVGEGTMMGQALAERAILENAGYDKIASTFDPFDPVSLAVGLVPGLLGAKFGHAAPKPLDAIKTEADVRRAAALTPDEAARSAAFERSAANLAELEGAIKAEKDPAKRLLLVDELETQRKAVRDNVVKDSMRADPDLEPAARVRQVADALDESRLTPDSDLRGMAAHQEAIETAHEQIARGEPVSIAGVAVPNLDVLLRTQGSIEALQAERSQLLPTAANLAEPGAIREARQELRTMEQQRPDTSDAGAKVLAKQIQENDGIGYRPALAQAKEQLAGQMSDFLARQQRLERSIETNAEAQRATQRVNEIDAALPAMEREVGPARTLAAMNELRATREQAQNPPHAQPAQVAAPEAAARNPGDAQSVLPALEPVAAKSAAGDGAEPGAAAASKAAAEVATLNPDLLVQLDGMDAPMRVADLMEKVKKEAADEAQIAKLVQVAAECALTA